jgi:hypothetical protein
MPSRSWQAPHGVAEQPATLSTGIPRVGSVRTRQLRPAPGKAVTDRQADRLLPILLPGWAVSALLSTAGTPKRRAELRELLCWKPRSRDVCLPTLQEVKVPARR